MGAVVGELLPLALGVAISPMSIIAVILMLLAPRAGGTSLGFLLGWLAGILVATGLCVWLASATGLGEGGQPKASSSWIKLVLGLLLIVLAAREWRSRPGPGRQAELPKWMATIDSFTPGKAAGLGLALAAVNPKNLTMCVAAGVAIAESGLAAGQTVFLVALFTILAGCSVAVPVIAHAVAAARMRGPLARLKQWLQANNSTVMAVLLLVIGVVLFGKGLGGLF